jgi:hypothetical protein
LLAGAVGMACGGEGFAQTRPVFGKPSNSMGSSNPYANACISRTCSFLSDSVPGSVGNYKQCSYPGKGSNGGACVCRESGRFHPGRILVANNCAPNPVVR